MSRGTVTVDAVERALAGERVVLSLDDRNEVRLLRIGLNLSLTVVPKRLILKATETPGKGGS